MKQGKSIKAVKAERTAKKKRARKRKRVIVLMVELVILFTLLSIGYMMSKYGKLQLNLVDDEKITTNEGMQKEGYTTIALFGGDSREGKLGAGTHADTMIVISINDETKEVKMVSVYRDLIAKQTDGTIKKANHAYFVGGPEQAINMLNRNFDLDIEDYVTVDFGAMANVVDLLGGIEVDVTEAEAQEMNLHIFDTAKIIGKTAKTVKPGLQKLNGLEALTYSRIRKNNTGGDYGRTARQRIVIQKLAEKVKQVDLATMNDIIDEVFPRIATSFDLKEILSLASHAMQYELGESKGFAFEQNSEVIEGLGSVIIPYGHVENVQELHAFLYPTEKYTPSDTVQKIAKEIEKLTGYTRADYQDPNETTESEDSGKTESEE